MRELNVICTVLDTYIYSFIIITEEVYVNIDFDYMCQLEKVK